MLSFKNAKRVLTLKLVHRAKSIKNMRHGLNTILLKKAIRLLKEKQRRLVRRTGARFLLATQKLVRYERKWKRILANEAEMRRSRGLPTLEEDARTLAGLPVMDAFANMDEPSPELLAWPLPVMVAFAHTDEPSPELLAWPCAYSDARGCEPVTDAQREANRSGWAYDDRTRRGGVANPCPQNPKARGIAPNIVIPSPSAAPGSSWDLL